jgi:hypothetical protein
MALKIKSGPLPWDEKTGSSPQALNFIASSQAPWQTVGILSITFSISLKIFVNVKKRRLCFSFAFQYPLK